MTYEQLMVGLFAFNIIFFLVLAVLGTVAVEKSSRPSVWHDRFLFIALSWTVICGIIAAIAKINMTGSLL